MLDNCLVTSILFDGTHSDNLLIRNRMEIKAIVPTSGVDCLNSKFSW